MPKGRVKVFKEEPGWGFITPDDKQINDGKDIFVHYTGIEGEGYKTLAPEQRVEFEVGQGKKGLQAEKVREIGG